MELFAFDDEYVRRLRLRDRATEEHFEQYFRDLLLIKLRRRLPSAEAIEDVRQEVFLRVLAHLDDLRDGRKLGAFVNSICELVLKEFYRKDARAAREDAPTPEEAPAIDELLINEEDCRRVRRVLSRLPERDREILTAVFLEELTKDQICGKFGVGPEYLRVLLHRAKQRFHNEFRRKSTPNFSVTLGGQSSLSH